MLLSTHLPRARWSPGDDKKLINNLSHIFLFIIITSSSRLSLLQESTRLRHTQFVTMRFHENPNGSDRTTIREEERRTWTTSEKSEKSLRDQFLVDNDSTEWRITAGCRLPKPMPCIKYKISPWCLRSERERLSVFGGILCFFFRLHRNELWRRRKKKWNTEKSSEMSMMKCGKRQLWIFVFSLCRTLPIRLITSK